ncbi:HIT domain-containing protein [Candidatus Peregrinibacteria bacterium]|jgi:histidine triad (HIT) family protein|nr:HIT domain-containing protein [Candidatus Peregrinibacteria bacterium]MBT7736426.1 HIT domain-containing protein [Candidatus Peregrinibacteria bacterium]
MDDCVFCKVIGGEFGTEFIYEDDVCVVFKDISPKDKTHLLIVPKSHISSIADMADADADTVSHLFMCARDVAKSLKLSGYRLQVNVGKDGGQEVFHLHVHLMSKFSS